MKWPETFTGACGPFGAPPARTCLGRWRARYLRGAAFPWWGARHCGRHFQRSVSTASVGPPTNEMTRNIHGRLWPLWGTPSTHLFGPVAGSTSPGGGLPALEGLLLPAPLLRSVSPAAVRDLPNEMARNIRKRFDVFGTLPARTCLGRWRARYRRGAACPRWGARHCRHCSGSCPQSQRGITPSENPAQDADRYARVTMRRPGSLGAKRTKTTEATQTQRCFIRTRTMTPTHTLIYPQKQDAGRAQSRPPGATIGVPVPNGPRSQARASSGPCPASLTALPLEGDPRPSRAEAGKSLRLPRFQDVPKTNTSRHIPRFFNFPG